LHPLESAAFSRRTPISDVRWRELFAPKQPTFRGVSFEKIDRLGSVQWPCNEDTDEAGTATMHIDRFVRGKGRFIITQYVATDEKVTRKFPLLMTTGRILSQYNVGAQTRRTENNRWHSEDRLEIHPHDAEERGIKTDNSDWATNCPEYKVTAVQVMPVMQPSAWQAENSRFNRVQQALLHPGSATAAVTAAMTAAVTDRADRAGRADRTDMAEVADRAQGQ